MTVINSKEFALNQKRYFDLAINEKVFIKRGKKRFQLVYDSNTVENAYNEPDDDFRRAISAEDFREKLVVVLDKVDRKYTNKCK